MRRPATALFLTGPIAHLPKAALGAAIVAAAVGLVDISAWRRLAATDRVEVAIAAVTTIGVVVVVVVLEAVVFAVGLTILDAVRPQRSTRRRRPRLRHGIEALGQLVDELRDDDVSLVAARMRSELKRRLHDARLDEQIGESRFYPSVAAAVSACAGEGTSNAGSEAARSAAS